MGRRLLGGDREPSPPRTPAHLTGRPPVTQNAKSPPGEPLPAPRQPLQSSAVGTGRILLHLDERTRRATDPGDVYFLEADGSDTLVRLRGSRRLRDVRPLPEVLTLFEPHGFLRIHRSHAVNLQRVREVRLQADGRDWELKLEPPVNRVLPIARSEVHALWEAFGERA